MKTRPSARSAHGLPLWLALALPGLPPLLAAEDALAALADFRYGQPAEKLAAVEAQVHQAATDPARSATVERALIAVLAGPASPEARRFACAQLRSLGTRQAVPALAAALADAEVGSAALAALEVLPDPAAGDALRAAVTTAHGRALIGLIHALGLRAESASVPTLLPLLERPEPEVVAAAVRALGRIADEPALAALRAVAAHFDPRAAAGADPLPVVRLSEAARADLAPALADAFLMCADRFLAAGRVALAATIYERLFKADAAPAAARVAALRGWVMSDPDRAAPHVFALLVSGAEGWDRIALGLLRELPAGQVTAALAPQLSTLPPARRAELLAVLAKRPVGQTAEILLAATRDADLAVRVAAWTGLGQIEADTTAVRELLAAAAERTGPEQAAARASLVRTRGLAADEVLLAGLRSGPAATRAECARALAARGTRSALPGLLEAAGDPSAAVRTAALQALAMLAGPAEYPALLQRLLVADNEADREAALKAVLAVAANLSDPADRTRPLIEAYHGASPAAKRVLLAGLGQLGGADALAVVRAALRDPEDAVQAEALATLAGWPDAGPLPDLLELAETASSPTRRIVALRGVTALADQATNLPPARLLEVYRRALAAAARPEEKRLVLAGLAHLDTPAALDLVEPLLAEAPLRDAAALATVQMARRLALRDPGRARAAVDLARAASALPAVQNLAREFLDELERDRDFVQVWLLAGPYTADGPGRLIDLEFPPETGGPVPWKPVSAPGGIVDLAGLLGGEQRVAYLRATLRCPRPVRVQLQLGSDDGLKVWLNGQVVHRADVDRGLVPGQDRVEVELREGQNTLLLKVVQFGGGWAACARIRGLDGASVPGLVVSTE